MAILYYADFSSAEKEEILNQYADKVDSERLSKITRTRDITARVRSLLAGYLLQRAVGGDGIIDLQYEYGKQGKPYLKDYPNLYFNLSHSGTVVACLVAGQEVGLDVQQYVKVKEGLAKRFFTKEECEMLVAVAEVGEKHTKYEQLFFELWSIKESYIKYTGQGMKQGLDTFTIDRENEQIEDHNEKISYQVIKTDKLPEYAISACMKQKEEIELVEVCI